jgi:hypothetical protein
MSSLFGVNVDLKPLIFEFTKLTLTQQQIITLLQEQNQILKEILKNQPK